ncbi:MAG: hypothetical protein AB1626_03855 [Candidatus Micrarchaeota archaeon]
MRVVASLLEEHFAPLQRLGKGELERHAKKTGKPLLQAAQHRSVAELKGFRSALAETHYEFDHRELEGLLELVSRRLPNVAGAPDQRGKVAGALRVVLLDYYAKKAADVKTAADLGPSRPLREAASRALEAYVGEDEQAEAEAIAAFKRTFGPLAAPALKRIIAADNEVEAHAKKFRASTTHSARAEALLERLNNMRVPLRGFATFLLNELGER